MRIKLEEESKEKSGAEELTDAPVSSFGRPPVERVPGATTLRVLVAEAEVRAISRALEYVGWNRRRAAQLLRISYRGLLYKIRQYNITAATRGPADSAIQLENLGDGK